MGITALLIFLAIGAVAGLEAAGKTHAAQRLGIALAAWALLAMGSAQAAALRVTIERPGVQTSQVDATGLTQRSVGFDGFPTGPFPPAGASIASNVGTYTRAGSDTAVADADAFGGAGGIGKYLDVGAGIGGESVELDFTAGLLSAASGVGYFGFWWSAIDARNELIITLASGDSETFSAQTILASPALRGSPGATGAGSHFGSPNSAFAGQNPQEPYAYVNLYAQDANSRMTSVVFRQLGGSTQAFETDNHVVIAELVDADRQTGTPIPLPATLPLFAAGLCALAVARRLRPAA